MLASTGGFEVIDGMTIWLPDDTGRAWHDKPVDEVQFNPTDDHTFTGHWGNLAISETKHGVTVKGSVAKFVNGQSTGYCNPDEYVGGLDRLGAELHIDFHNGIVRAAEFCAMEFPKQPTHEYLDLLGGMKGERLGMRSDKNPLGILETVTYTTPKGGVIGGAGLTPSKSKVYDKAKEVAKHKEQVPDWCKGRNLLRLELRINGQRKVREWLGAGKDLSPYDLIRDEVYSKFKERFLSRYKSIEKVGREVHMTNKTHTVRSFLDCLALYTAQHNTDFYNELMASAKAAGTTPYTISRIRSALRKAAADIEQVGSNELIDEVNDELQNCI